MENKNIIVLIIIIVVIATGGYFYVVNKQKSNKDKQLKDSLKDFMNRPIHKNLTKETLFSAQDVDLEQIVFDNIFELIKDSPPDEYRTLDKLNSGQKAFYSTWVVESEINNGGFNQLYFNNGKEFVEISEGGFELIEAKKTANLVKKANKLYESIENDLKKFNDGTKESFSKSYDDNPLNDLDTIFYKLNTEEDLSKLRVKYIKLHTDEFISP